MAWVLRCDKVYNDGKIVTHYHKRIALGLFHEVCGNQAEAKHFKTKKEANAERKSIGLSTAWYAEKVA